jgi:hypothetical protein
MLLNFSTPARTSVCWEDGRYFVTGHEAMSDAARGWVEYDAD